MVTKVTSRLQQFFEQRADRNLRSIVEYDPESFDVVYLRDDVADLYSDAELAESVDESRMESMTVPIYENTFASDHGDLTCLVKCFENVVEMNFVLSAGVGAAVALDAAAMSDVHGLVGEAREIVVEERERH